MTSMHLKLKCSSCSKMYNVKLLLLALTTLLWASELRSTANAAANIMQRSKRAANTTIYWHFGDDQELQSINKEVRNNGNMFKTNTIDILNVLKANSEAINAMRQEFNQHLLNISQRQNALEATVGKMKPKQVLRNLDAYPKSCADFTPTDSGVYMLYIGDKTGLSVYCERDPDGGPAWTIVQRVTHQNVFKKRTWHDYKNGFGDVEKDHWLGLKNIYKLQSLLNGSLELWLYKNHTDGRIQYLKYKDFSIESSSTAYALKSIKKIAGNGFDNFLHSLGRNFTMEYKFTDGTLMPNGWWCDKNGEYCEGMNYEYGNFNYGHMAIRANSAK